MESGNGDGKEVVTGSEVSEETKVKALSTFLTAIGYEETTLHSTQELLARQKSLNTVYQKSLSYQSTTADRKKAIGYRNTIAKANIDYITLQTLWTVRLIYIFRFFLKINVTVFKLFSRKIKMVSRMP